MTVTAHPEGPVDVAERSLGPDLARGLMLLFIALANSHYFLRGDAVLGGYPQDRPSLDAAVTWVIATFVDGRAFPMFGLLFGYGVAQIARRYADRGRRSLRRMLWRRSAVLVAVGLLDGFLFFVGDILAMYGVLLSVGVWAIGWKDRWLIVVAALFFAVTSLPGPDSSSISTDPPDVTMVPPDLATMFGERALVVPFIALVGPVGFAAPFLVGLWAGRRRLLEQVDRHRVLLRVVAAFGIGAAVVGAQPVSLMLAGATDVPPQGTLELIGPLHDATGVLGGFGYAALIALIGARLRRPGAVPVRAIAAAGQRSMTCYLAQSPVWALLFTPFLLDLSDDLSVAGTAAIAAATWFGSVLVADRMARAGNRGPFERLVRRVTYGRPGAGAQLAGLSAPTTHMAKNCEPPP